MRQIETFGITAFLSLDDSSRVLWTAAREEVPSRANERLEMEAAQQRKPFGSLSGRGHRLAPARKDFIAEGKRVAKFGVYQVIVTKWAGRAGALRAGCPHGR